MFLWFCVQNSEILCLFQSNLSEFVQNYDCLDGGHIYGKNSWGTLVN